MDGIGQGGPWAGIVDRRWDEAVVLESLSKTVQPLLIRQVLEQTGRKSRRIRRLPAAATVWLVIAMSIFRDMDVPSVWRQVIGTLQALWMAGASRRPPCKSALSAARARLGARPLRALFRQTVAPIATDQTHGAFYHGMRLMAIDGVHLDIADTLANATAFGRGATTRSGERVEGAFPQIHVVGLIEIGTHVICEAVVKPGKKHEFRSALHLLKDVPDNSLVLWDKGFYGHQTIADALERNVQVLGQVASHVKFERLETLSDGSFLAKIYPTFRGKRRHTGGIKIRVIEYTINDKNRHGHGERHRVYTTLLDCNTYPAKELVVLYHERWEFEIANDEVKTHQLTKDMPTHLRSKTPVGVIQEFYGLLLAYNAVRTLMHEAACAVNVDPGRLSFIHALRVIQETTPILRASATAQLPYLYRSMILHIAMGTLPEREDRANPRVVKRKMSKFAKKRPEHCRPPPPERPFHAAVVVLK